MELIGKSVSKQMDSYRQTESQALWKRLHYYSCDVDIFCILKTLLSRCHARAPPGFFPTETSSCLVNLLNRRHLSQVHVLTCSLVAVYTCSNVSSRTKVDLVNVGIIHALDLLLKVNLKTEAQSKLRTVVNNQKLGYEALSSCDLADQVTSLLVYFSLGSNRCIDSMVFESIVPHLIPLLNWRHTDMYPVSATAISCLEALVTNKHLVARQQDVDMDTTKKNYMIYFSSNPPRFLDAHSGRLLDLYDTTNQHVDVNVAAELTKDGHVMASSYLPSDPGHMTWTDVEIQTIIGPCRYWAWLGGEKTRNTVTKIKGQLVKKVVEELPLVAPPGVGNIVIVSEESQRPYRGCVLHTSGEKVRVFAIDYGFIKEVLRDVIYHMDPDIRIIPPQAVYCELHGVMMQPHNIQVVCNMISVLCNLASKIDMTVSQFNSSEVVSLLLTWVLCDHHLLQVKVLRTLCNMARHPKIRELLGKAGTIEVVIGLVQSHSRLMLMPTGQDVLEVALFLLTNLIYESPDNKLRLTQANGLEFLLLEILSKDAVPEKVHQAGIGVLRVYVGHSKLNNYCRTYGLDIRQNNRVTKETRTKPYDDSVTMETRTKQSITPVAKETRTKPYDDRVTMETRTNSGTGATTETRTNSGTRATTETRTNSGTGATTETRTNSGTGATTETRTNSGTGTTTETRTNSGTGTTTETRTNSGTRATTETRTNSGTEATTETRTNSGTGTTMETRTNSGTGTTTETRTNSGTRATTETRTNSGTGTTTETRTNSGTGTTTETRTNSGTRATTETRTNSGMISNTDYEAEKLSAVSKPVYPDQNSSFCNQGNHRKIRPKVTTINSGTRVTVETMATSSVSSDNGESKSPLISQSESDLTSMSDSSCEQRQLTFTPERGNTVNGVCCQGNVPANDHDSSHGQFNNHGDSNNVVIRGDNHGSCSTCSSCHGNQNIANSSSDGEHCSSLVADTSSSDTDTPTHQRRPRWQLIKDLLQTHFNENSTNQSLSENIPANQNSSKKSSTNHTSPGIGLANESSSGHIPANHSSPGLNVANHISPGHIAANHSSPGHIVANHSSSVLISANHSSSPKTSSCPSSSQIPATISQKGSQTVSPMKNHKLFSGNTSHSANTRQPHSCGESSGAESSTIGHSESETLKLNKICLVDTAELYYQSHQKRYIKGESVDFIADISHDLQEKRFVRDIKTKFCQKIACSFLNTGEGGSIYWGLHQKNTVMGIRIDRDCRDQLRMGVDRFMSEIKPAISPVLYEVIYTPVYARMGDIEPLTDVYIIEIQISPVSGTIYSVPDGTVYLRHGNTTKKASAQDINSLTVENEEKHYIEELDSLQREITAAKSLLDA